MPSLNFRGVFPWQGNGNLEDVFLGLPRLLEELIHWVESPGRGVRGIFSSIFSDFRQLVMLAGKRVSSAMEGKFERIPEVWIPVIPAGMTIFDKRDDVI